MNAKTNEASLAEKMAHTGLMIAHTKLMEAQARVTIAQAVELENKNKQTH